jgi:xanthine phosphoribosyltransferase
LKLLEERILKDGRVYPGNILKVDNFLNHQIDVRLLEAMGEEFYRLFKDDGVNKILTIEASGIAIACMTAYRFNVPLVFAKKNQTKNISADVYTSKVTSYTHGRGDDIMDAKDYLNPGDRVLIVDDFLANGKALEGLIDIVRQAGAEVAGAGIAIEKCFQPGGKELREKGVRIESLAMVRSLDNNTVVFC